MPITKSSKKALRQNIKRGSKNRRAKENLKNLVKKVRSFAAEKKTKEAKELLPQVYKTLDKAAKTGLIKKSAAARKKSRIAKLINVKVQSPNVKSNPND